MHKVISLIIFIVFEILAVVSCLVLLVLSILPVLFIVTDGGDDPNKFDYFGVFNHFHPSASEAYENTTSFFKWIQALFTISLVLSILSVVFAVLGYKIKKFKASSGGFMVVTGNS
ncbi:hypothetical protein RF11_15024 [Thelohanellus kitauei]|uniref:Uncharacterized protein n=1 Tax=Thelohanellus kitauei TaxID=669202 RepID=A0A0C2MHH2_THEKT|nr:hypothetical protein RF11_15024 [Thelohanellus kitauei]